MPCTRRLLGQPVGTHWIRWLTWASSLRPLPGNAFDWLVEWLAQCKVHEVRSSYQWSTARRSVFLTAKITIFTFKTIGRKRKRFFFWREKVNSKIEIFCWRDKPIRRELTEESLHFHWPTVNNQAGQSDLRWLEPVNQRPFACERFKPRVQTCLRSIRYYTVCNTHCVSNDWSDNKLLLTNHLVWFHSDRRKSQRALRTAYCVT